MSRAVLTAAQLELLARIAAVEGKRAVDTRLGDLLPLLDAGLLSVHLTDAGRAALAPSAESKGETL